MAGSPQQTDGPASDAAGAAGLSQAALLPVARVGFAIAAFVTAGGEQSFAAPKTNGSDP